MTAYNLAAQDAGGHSRHLLWALVTTFTFMIVETLGGWLCGSLALLADAGHMLTDSVALLGALLASYFSAQHPDARHSFGYLRLTTLVAFCNALALLVIVVLIIGQALSRLFAPQPVAATAMLVVAIGGLLSNMLAFWLLHAHRREPNLNIRAAALHVFSDLLGSIAAIIAAMVILWRGWTAIDPVLSILVSLLIVYHAWQLLKESAHELMEGTPQQVSIRQLQHELSLAIPEVRNIHHVHLWQIGEKRIITLHAKVIPPYQHDRLLEAIADYLQQHYHIDHATIQMEYEDCDDQHCAMHQADLPQRVHHHQH